MASLTRSRGQCRLCWNEDHTLGPAEQDHESQARGGARVSPERAA